MDMKRILAVFLVVALALYGCATEQPVQQSSGGGVNVVSSCSDTDYGKNPLVKGTAESASGRGTDTCLGEGSKVMEYYCSGEVIKTEDIECVGNTMCKDGACVDTPCFDTDNGQDLSLAGTVQYRDVQYKDACTSDGKVTEYFCDASGMQQAVLSCAQGYECSEGKCVQKEACTDSDGGKNAGKGGTTSFGGIVRNDYCVGATSVVEYYCDGNEIKLQQIQCASGESCIDGVCAFVPHANECSDSDGGKNIYEKGTVTYWSGGQRYTDTESCYGYDRVWENWCEEDATVGFGVMDCDEGEECVNGACTE